MPVILEKEEEDIWLNPDINEVSQLCPLLKPFPDDKLEEWEVGAKARNPINDYPKVIEPLKTANNEVYFKHLNRNDVSIINNPKADLQFINFFFNITHTISPNVLILLIFKFLCHTGQ